MATSSSQVGHIKAVLHDKLAGLGIESYEVEYDVAHQKYKVIYWMKKGAVAHETVVTKNMVEDHGPECIVAAIVENIKTKDVMHNSIWGQEGLLGKEQSKAFVHKLINTPTLLASIEAAGKAKMKQPLVFTPGPIKKEVVDDWFKSDLAVPYFDVGVDPAIGPDQTIISSASTGSGKSVITSAALIKAAKDFKEMSHAEAVKKHPKLAPYIAAVVAIEKKMNVDNLTDREKNIVMKRVEQNTVNSIEKGIVPKVAIKSKQQTAEKELTR